MAMAQTKFDRFDSDSSSDGESMHTTHPISGRAGEPWFPPPPTAAVPQHQKKRPRVRQKPRAVEEIPPLPPLPPLSSLPSPPPEPVEVPRVKARRKTILERIDGWWDLGLLDKRQTLFGGANLPSTPRRG